MSAGQVTWAEVTSHENADPQLAAPPGSMGQVRVYKGDWTAGSGGTATGTTPVLNGCIQGVAFVPGSPAPTGGHVIKATNRAGIDVFGGLGGSLSATVTTQDCPLTGTNVMPFPVNGTLTTPVTGAGAGAKGTIYIWVR